MNEEHAREIIKNERLKRVNLFREGGLSEREMVVRYNHVTDRYEVFGTDERAAVVSISEFESKEEALDNFIFRAKISRDIWG
ncbi:hypothetical protein I6N95_26295 [Vagococcus sp. BWB3-3]|uniref:Uncharacterized protein n=1 Tax=Vagococcus allomyrinae TaxID=2794353 RepID=A0A940PBG0_9ENTE|nr:Imm59 family immunity protein [Vagococcus allomyrinae]MBP1044525.1 hypothetical protein [Vagococcus allomyrinae]